MTVVAISLRTSHPARASKRARELLDLGAERLVVEGPLPERAWSQVRDLLPRESVLAMRLFQPLPDSWRFDRPAPFEPAPTSRLEREPMIRQAVSTLETADAVGAPFVLVPVVRLEAPGLERGLIDPARVLDRTSEISERRRAEAAMRLDDLLWSLSRLLDRAVRYGVTLLITPSNRPAELPDVREATRCFEEFRGAPLGLWLDAARWPVEYVDVPTIGAPKTPTAAPIAPVGIAVHDARGEREHLAPGDGALEWDLLKPSLRRLGTMCLDLHADADADQLRAGLGFIEEASRPAPDGTGPALFF